MGDITDLILLFFSSLIAATILPAQSELILVGLSALDQYPKWLLLLIASAGNVLGAVMNWILGRYLIHFRDRKWFPIKKNALDKATIQYQKYGVWTLLLAWMPLIGDPLTLVAGIFRTHFWLFLILVTIGKVSRYVLLLSLV